MASTTNISSELLGTLTSMQSRVFRYGMVPLIPLGIIGNLFNLVIFLQPNLRTNPCSVYFMAYSVTNLCWTSFNTVTSTLNYAFSIDISTWSESNCKIRTFFTYIFAGLSPIFLTLATLDRAFITMKNQSIRQFSSLRMAAYSISSVVGLWVVLMIPGGIYPGIQQISSTRKVCTIITDSVYGQSFQVIYAVNDGLIIPLILLVLVSITLANTHRRTRQVFQLHALSLYRPSYKERQLITMLLSQVLFTAVCQSFFSIYLLYGVVTRAIPKTSARQTIELFAYATAVYICYWPIGFNFYLNLLTTKTFRNEFSRVVKKVLDVVRCEERH